MGELGTADILRERCKHAYDRIPAAVAGTLVLSFMVSAYFWRSQPAGLLLFWQATMAALALALGTLGHAYRRRDTSDDAPLWTRRIALGAAALGAGWGYAAAVFFPGSEGDQAFIAFIVALVSATALPVLSTLWWVYAIHAAAIMLPFNVVLFMHGTAFQQILGAAVPLLYIANVITARELGKAFISAYRLRNAYQSLSGDNAEIQAQLGEQLDSLLDAHREVHAASRKLALFSERAPIAVLEVDPNATILEMNPASENLFGYGAAELLGRSCMPMLLGMEDRQRAEKWWSEFVAAGRPATLVAERCVRRDGLELACEWTLTPLSDDDERVTSIVLHGRDITQQRIAERVRGEFTSTLSHELRTPLTSILGSLQLLRSGALGDLQREQDDLVEVAERNGQRLLDLINEVLDIEKIESGRLSLVPESIDLEALLAESIRLNQGFADRFQVRLAMQQASSASIAVRADRKRLMQVMTNFLSNAAKFSPPGSAVDVSFSVAGDTVKVGVGDRGPGIPQAFRGRIFGRFAQAHLADARIKGGTGLGLAISKRLIEMMQGRVGFDDREGGGTTFYFELPVLRAAESAGEDVVRVLVTEHDSVSADYLAMVLEKGGYRVDIAPDASATKALLARWKYAAWLLTRRLGDGADALSLVAEAKNQARVIMLAGLTSDEAALPQAERHRIADWLSKSDSRARILEVVDQAVAQAAA